MRPSERLQSEARVPPVAGRTKCEATRASRPNNQLTQPKDEVIQRIHSLFRLRKRIRPRQALVFAALFLALAPACLPDFPPPPQTTIPLFDAGSDATAPDGGGGGTGGEIPPVDAGPVDARLPAPDLAGGCPAIDIEAPTLRFRAWDGMLPIVNRLRVGGGCAPLTLFSTPDWLMGSLEGEILALTLETDPPPGQATGRVVVRDAQGNTAELPVTLEHFAGGGQRPKVLVYAVAGLGVEPLPPHMAWLTSHALSTAVGNVPPEAVGNEVAAWASLLTGFNPSEHRVTTATAQVAVPSFPRRAQQADHPTALGSQWAPLAGVIEPEVGVVSGDFDGSLAHVLTRLQEPERDLFVLAQDELGVARAAGRPLEEPLRRVDEALSRLLSAVIERPTFTQEDWLVVLVGVPAAGSEVPLAFARPGRPAGALVGKAGLLDVAPTVLHHLGVTLEPGWQLPGLLAGGEVEALCDNRLDDDGDGRLDCRDEDCQGGCDFECVTHDVGQARGRLVAADVDDLVLDQVGTCGGGDTPGLAVRWTAPIDDVYLVHTDGSELESVVYVRAPDCAAPELACGRRLYDTDNFDEPGSVLLQAQAGESFILFADADFFVFSGGLQIQLFGQRAECEAARDLGRQEGRVAEGDNRAAVTRLSPRLGTELCDDNDPPPTAYDTLFRWRAPRAGLWRFATAGSTYDTVLRVFGGGCAQLVPRACHDDVDTQAGELNSQIDLNLRVDEEVFIALSAFWRSGPQDRDRGGYVLQITPAQ